MKKKPEKMKKEIKSEDELENELLKNKTSLKLIMGYFTGMKSRQNIMIMRTTKIAM